MCLDVGFMVWVHASQKGNSAVLNELCCAAEITPGHCAFEKVKVVMPK